MLLARLSWWDTGIKNSLRILFQSYFPKPLTKKKLLRPVSTSFSPLKTFLGRALRIQTQRKTAKKARDPKAREKAEALEANVKIVKREARKTSPRPNPRA